MCNSKIMFSVRGFEFIGRSQIGDTVVRAQLNIINSRYEGGGQRIRCLMNAGSWKGAPETLPHDKGRRSQRQIVSERDRSQRYIAI